MTRLIELAKTTYSNLLKQLYEASIEAVSEKNWSTLKSTAELMVQPSLAIFQVHAHIARLKKRLPPKDAEFKAAPYQEILHWARLIQPAYRKWQEKQIESLNDPLWWHGCFEKIKTFPLEQQEKANNILYGLQEKCRVQNAYAHYRTLDIIHVYQTVMPVFSEWLNYAKTELEQREGGLTSRQKTFYQNYLNWFEAALTEEKVLLRTCLRERLVIGLKKGYGAWDQVIGSFQDELKAIGILPKEFRSDRVAYGYLTPEAFVAIQQLIEQDGSEEEKEDLHALAYYRSSFDNDAPFAEHKRQYSKNGKHHYWLSRSDTVSFKSIVYRHLPRFLQWLLWDEEVQERFFQHPHYQFLLAQEAVFLNAELEASSAVLTDLLIHPGWQQHQMCLNLLLSERERIEKWLKHPLAFFFPGSVKQLVDYQEAIQQSAHRWMIKQLFLIEQSLEHKENGSLNTEEKSAIASALANIDVMQKQWLFSPEILAEIIEVKQWYHTLCNFGEGESLLSLPKSTEKQPLPLRDEFRESVNEAIKTFEVTQIFPNPQVETLKNALPMNTSTYDSVALRTQLVDQLEKNSELPTPLKDALETILDHPKFDEKLLTHEENVELRKCFNKNQSMIEKLKQSMQVIQSPVEKPLSVLDEDPWGYDQQKLEQHCQTLKAIFAKEANYPTTEQNHRLCQYILRFLEKTQNLPNWEAFLLHRTQIKQLLQASVEISVGFLSLHQALIKVAAAEDTLDSNSWNSFVRTNLSVRIGTLARFVNISNGTELTHPDAASYWSQRTLLKAPSESNTLKTSSLQSDIPVPTL